MPLNDPMNDGALLRYGHDIGGSPKWHTIPNVVRGCGTCLRQICCGWKLQNRCVASRGKGVGDGGRTFNAFKAHLSATAPARRALNITSIAKEWLPEAIANVNDAGTNGVHPGQGLDYSLLSKVSGLGLAVGSHPQAPAAATAGS